MYKRGKKKKSKESFIYDNPPTSKKVRKGVKYVGNGIE